MDRLRKEAVRLLQDIADEDLATARVCLAAKPALVRSSAFHSQQTAEKHIKAWLIALGDDEPPTVHDLPRLADRLATFGGGRLPLQPLQFLTKFAVAPRYALGHVSLPEAEQALAEAEQIVETARKAVAVLAAGDEDTQPDDHP
jgi:HEPN domain-containing protein